MIKFRQKEYSLGSRLKASLNGAKWGAILTPGNIILALCGKKKVSLIMTAIGSGIGAGIGFYYGWKGDKNTEEYQKKLKEDPKFQTEKKEELRGYIKDQLKNKDLYPSESECRKSGVPFRSDFYEYLHKYSKFRGKYYDTWTKSWENLKTIEEIDIDFDIVFPTPYIDREKVEGNQDYIAANGDSSSDHFWIMWNPEEEKYNNDLGSGSGSGKTLLEASKNFASQWIETENKIEDPGMKEVARVHNKIIREFMKL